MMKRHRQRQRYQEEQLHDEHSETEEFEVEYDYNPTDLYLHIINSDWKYSLDSIERNPVEARIWVVKRDHLQRSAKCRFLPIHSACARQPPFEIISALLSIYPEGATKRDGNGMYPLHYACANQASPEVIELLLDAFPDANFDRLEGSGTLPIHLLARWGASAVSVVDILLDGGNASLACARDGDGQLPLDLAYEADYYEERDGIIQKLKEAEKQANQEGGDDSTISSCSLEEWSQSQDTGRHQLDVLEKPLFKKIIRMQSEIEILREQKDMTKFEVDEEIAKEWQAVRDYIKQMQVDYPELEDNLESRDEGHNDEDADEETDRHTDHDGKDLSPEERIQLKEVRDENRELEKQLKEAKEMYQMYKNKAEVTKEILVHLASNLEKLVEEQKGSLERTKAMEEQSQVISAVRQTRLEEMMNEEKEYTVKIIDQERAALVRALSTDKLVAKEQVVLAQLSQIIDES